MHLGDNGHGIHNGIGSASGSRAGCGAGRLLYLNWFLGHHLWYLSCLFLRLLRFEAELVLLSFELAFNEGFLHLEALELLLL